MILIIYLVIKLKNKLVEKEIKIESKKQKFQLDET